MFWRGGRARFIATVLKTVIPKGIGGSNPSLSANKWKTNPDGDGGKLLICFVRVFGCGSIPQSSAGRVKICHNLSNRKICII